jgi:hypothetical protein
MSRVTSGKVPSGIGGIVWVAIDRFALQIGPQVQWERGLSGVVAGIQMANSHAPAVTRVGGAFSGHLQPGVCLVQVPAKGRIADWPEVVRVEILAGGAGERFKIARVGPGEGPGLNEVRLGEDRSAYAFQPNQEGYSNGAMGLVPGVLGLRSQARGNNPTWSWNAWARNRLQSCRRSFECGGVREFEQ